MYCNISTYDRIPLLSCADLLILAFWNYLLFEPVVVKVKFIALGIMLLSSSNFALADTAKVDEEHLRAHRIYEEENLERQRFKLESGLVEDRHGKNHSDSADLPKPEKNSNSRPPFNFDEYTGTYFFGQYQLNQSGMPLQFGNYGIFKCEPSFSKSWKDYDNPYIQRGFENENSESVIVPNQSQQSSVDLNIVAP